MGDGGGGDTTMTTLREVFEAFWGRRYGLTGTPPRRSPSVPVLDCFDRDGRATVESVERSLDQCWKRMAELRLKIREEEYLEEFFCWVLRDGLADQLRTATDATVHDNYLTEKAKGHTVFPHSCESVEEKLSDTLSPRPTIAERRLLFEDLSKGSYVDRERMKKRLKIFPRKSPAVKGNVVPGENATDGRTEIFASVFRLKGSPSCPSGQNCEMKIGEVKNAPCQNVGVTSSAAECLSTSTTESEIACVDGTLDVAVSVTGVSMDSNSNLEVANDSQGVASDSQEVANDSQGVASDSQEVANESQEVANESQEVANESQEVANESQEVANESQEMANESQEVSNVSKEVANDSKEVANDSQGVTNVSKEVTNDSKEVANDSQGVASDSQEVASDSKEVANESQEVANESQEVSSDSQKVANESQKVANESQAVASDPQVLTVFNNLDNSSVEETYSSDSIRRIIRAPASETGSVGTDDDTISDENSDDDASNLLALRHSVNFASKWCEGVDSSRTRLEEQTQRLSRWFTQLSNRKSTEASKFQELDVVAEMPTSPTESPVSELETADGDAEWIPETSLLLTPLMDMGVSNKESPGGELHPEKSDMCRWVVSSLLENEKAYMEVLDLLINYKQMFKNFAGTPNMVVTLTEVETIFYRVADLHVIHYQFVRDLEPVVLNWSPDQQVAETFKILAMEEYSIAPDYLRNYSKALSTIHVCRTASPQFDALTKDISVKGTSGMEKTTLEDMLHKPIVRFQRNILLLHDLIKYTPISHPDYDLLQKTLKFARRFLDDLENSESNRDSPENQRYLARHGLIVEKVNRLRKLRHIFLFNDVIVAAKQKPPGRNRVQYEVKWFIPINDLSLEDKIGLRDDVILEQDLSDEVVLLQRKISDLQAALKIELKKARGVAESSRIKLRKPVTNKSIEKIRKKLMEQEAALIIASPSLVFRLYNPRAHKQYLLMMSSDYERTDWRDAITGLLFKAPDPAHLTIVDAQNLVNEQKLANLKATGGTLNENDSAACHIEVDSFGHFTLKAKTNSTSESIDPAWNEDFEIDLDGAQTLRILCYHSSKGIDQLFGKGALELRSVWLKDGSEEDCIVSVNNEMSVTVSLQYTSREKTIPRCLSTVTDGLFGIRLDIITEREGVAVPILVTSCIEEIEKRGICEEGLYRVSGLVDTVQILKDAFEKNSQKAVSQVKGADINSLTGLIKLFFRMLPESLFTDALYKNLQKGIGLADPDARDRCLVSLFGTLPEPNFSIAYFLLDHLISVAKHETENKMTLKNLATIFGPTLLRPATRNSQTHNTAEQLFFLSAHEAMLQTTILLHLMTIRASGVEFKRSVL